MFTTTHLLAHTVIFFGYLLACVLVPTSFLALTRINKLTIAAAAGFFVFCGLTHIGLAFDQSEAAWVTVTDHAQALAILTFVVSLSVDLYRTVARLRAAFDDLRAAYGEHIGVHVENTVRAALQDK